MNADTLMLLTGVGMALKWINGEGFDDVTAPDGIVVPRWVCDDPQRSTVMSEIATVGLDLAKNVFQLHGADDAGRAVLRRKLRRDHLLSFLGQLPPCVVAMEACGGAHFWGREIGKLGHEVRLIPPAYVKIP